MKVYSIPYWSVDLSVKTYFKFKSNSFFFFATKLGFVFSSMKYANKEYILCSSEFDWSSEWLADGGLLWSHIAVRSIRAKMSKLSLRFVVLHIKFLLHLAKERKFFFCISFMIEFCWKIAWFHFIVMHFVTEKSYEI